MPLVGLNPLCAVLAIAVPYAGIFAKVYAEIQQESDQPPLQGLPAQTGDDARIGDSGYSEGLHPAVLHRQRHQ